MNNDKAGRTAADLVSQVFSQIEGDTNKTLIGSSSSVSVLNSWKKIVSGVNPDGERLAAHSRVIDLKNGILQVETDHPGWIQIFQFNKTYLLKRLHYLFPSIEIHSISFRLSGNTEQKKAIVPEMTRTQRLEELEKLLQGQTLPTNVANTDSVASKVSIEEGPLAEALKKLKTAMIEKNKKKAE